MVIGDQDGVVVVAREALRKRCRLRSPDVKAKEDKMEALVAKGATLPPGFEQFLAEKGVQFLD